MSTSATELRPICYMVMPFRTKRVEEPRPAGAPAEIDFDRLWELAYRPAIERMGYLPMRADADPSTAIVQAMLERIAFADLVLADVTLGNGNCYYEIGVRHVAKETRCVLVAPTWTRPLFDIAQFTSIRFPLTDGTIAPAEATAISDLLASTVPALADSQTPYYALIGAALENSGRKSAFRDFAIRMSDFQSALRGIRMDLDAERRKARLHALLVGLPPSTLSMAEVAVELVTLVRDALGWPETIQLIERLPASTRRLPWIREQRALATAKSGKPGDAIAELQQLISDLGETAERLGLIAGRYKALWSDARKARMAAGDAVPSRQESQHLSKAIEYYERGMQRDYNEYFCACNIPSLLRVRGEEGDAERAAVVEHFVVAACERARALGTGDVYLRPTLLGAAFRAGDVVTATSLTREIERDGPAVWQLQGTIADLVVAVEQMPEGPQRDKLHALCARLEGTLA